MEANKINYKLIITNIALLIAMLFSGVVSMLSSYNLLGSYDFGIDVSAMYSMMRWITPVVGMFIYYALYRVYINLMRSTLNARMGVFNKLIGIVPLREIVDPYMVGLTIYVGLVNLFFLFFPIYRNALLTICKEIGVILYAYLVYRRLGKNLDKVYYPIMFWGMQLPLILLVVLV